MKLSVVIVNYNVKYFLEQCLYSVFKAIQGIEAEVFVVDNNSVDGSCQMIRDKFSWVKLIANTENVGFSRANNQAIRISTGEYVLLLNPDTIVQEDSFKKCIDFMDSHSDAGALGVKMIDGKGNFLPESKRAVPTPWVAFYKIFGLSKLFPRSRKFGRYHLGYLDKDEIHEVEILSGAFMFIRRKVLDEIGLLDESFFMYGEDIDLSYRIIKAGYKNFYFPETSIIHYKGESTKKGSLNYVILFYNAMIIFTEKHFKVKKGFKLFIWLIHLAIYLRASLSIFKRAVQAIFLPLMDILIIYSGFLLIKPVAESIKFEGFHYPSYYLTLIVPCYIFVWFISMLFSGVYDKPYRIEKILRGIGIGTIIILAIYGLLPEDLRFSRLMIVSGALWSLLALVIFRYLLHFSGIKTFQLSNAKRKKIAIVSNNEEFGRIRHLLSQTAVNAEVIGYISETLDRDSNCLGTFNQIADIVNIYSIDEIIFSGKDIESQKIVYYMMLLSPQNIEYKIAPPESVSIIGSSSINTAGDLYLVQLDTINNPTNRRLKRLFDIIFATVLLILYPVFLFFYKNKIQLLNNIFKALIGRYTLVGYCVDRMNNSELCKSLPPLKKGILSPVDVIKTNNLTPEMVFRINMFYAKDYKISNDFNILRKGLAFLDKEAGKTL
jgi:GT2 family glycosyltransferase/lipopolysaccharide/colanic/teichoic acid biosynthesis glycosyltransferase